MAVMSWSTHGILTNTSSGLNFCLIVAGTRILNLTLLARKVDDTVVNHNSVITLERPGYSKKADAVQELDMNIWNEGTN